MMNATVVKDPVCGMDIDTAAAPASHEYKGRTYYFCGHTCEQKFMSTPEQYLGKPASAGKGGASCCN